MARLRLFTSKGEIVNRTTPDVGFLLKALDRLLDATVVVYGCSDNGHLGAVLASYFPESKVFLVTDNLKDSQTVERNLKENDLHNAISYLSNNLEFLHGDVPTAIVMKPSGYEGKQRLRAMMSESLHYLAKGGNLYLVTHMRHGAPSLMKMMNDVFGNYEVVKKGGGGIRIVKATKSDSLSEPKTAYYSPNLIEVEILGRKYKFQTIPGLFSKEYIDKGTSLLLASIEIGDAQNCLDLGCGYGAIGISIADRYRDRKVILVDVNAQAIKIAEANILLNKVESNAVAILSDGLNGVGEIKFDLILSHFPLHIPGQEKIRLLGECRLALNPGGRLCLVVVAAYDLRQMVNAVFGNVQVMVDTSEQENPKERYRILCATRGNEV